MKKLTIKAFDKFGAVLLPFISLALRFAHSASWLVPSQRLEVAGAVRQTSWNGMSGPIPGHCLENQKRKSDRRPYLVSIHGYFRGVYSQLKNN
ncbi:unnamed protein product [Sphenostylis stenocarpa]|uniref:Uncharacterized protein n=1 Tax=Sphenostylis stenocarpa TaxID=92480 RepID=A0AA86VKJ6_9FABA|nr:unnamed protein product [Sphenostylis stenocarpa]